MIGNQPEVAVLFERHQNDLFWLVLYYYEKRYFHRCHLVLLYRLRLILGISGRLLITFIGTSSGKLSMIIPCLVHHKTQTMYFPRSSYVFGRLQLIRELMRLGMLYALEEH